MIDPRKPGVLDAPLSRSMTVIARSVCDEAIQLFSVGAMDCFAGARNDVVSTELALLTIDWESRAAQFRLRRREDASPTAVTFGKAAILRTCKNTCKNN
jgi:hypothetical protein